MKSSGALDLLQFAPQPGHAIADHPAVGFDLGFTRTTEETEATALWYLHDNMWILNHQVKTHGTAIYRDRYLKVNGKWLIKDTSYERLYEINDILEERPKLSSHYLGVHGTEPQF